MFYFYKNISIGVLASILSGCLATTNLLTDGTLNSEDLSIVNSMVERTVRYCVTYKANSSGGKRSGDQPVSKLPEVKAFYVANDNWYKADVLTANSTWFSIYFNSKTNKFTCGKSWDDYSESRTVQFVRKDVSTKSINDVTPMPMPTPTPQPQPKKSIESKLSEVKSLFDKNLITSQQYDEQVKRILVNH